MFVSQHSVKRHGWIIEGTECGVSSYSYHFLLWPSDLNSGWELNISVSSLKAEWTGVYVNRTGLRSWSIKRFLQSLKDKRCCCFEAAEKLQELFGWKSAAFWRQMRIFPAFGGASAPTSGWMDEVWCWLSSPMKEKQPGRGCRDSHVSVSHYFSLLLTERAARAINSPHYRFNKTSMLVCFPIGSQAGWKAAESWIMDGFWSGGSESFCLSNQSVCVCSSLQWVSPGTASCLLPLVQVCVVIRRCRPDVRHPGVDAHRSSCLSAAAAVLRVKPEAGSGWLCRRQRPTLTWGAVAGWLTDGSASVAQI